MTSKGVARKALLIVTLVITIPLCVACVYFAEQQKKIILMENGQQLSRVSNAIAQQIPQNGQPVFIWHASQIGDELLPEQIKVINDYYQPIVDKLAELYPSSQMGIYHRYWDRVITSYQANNELTLPLDQAVINVYDTREAATAIINSKSDGSAVMMSVAPIFYRGEVVGYAWASRKIDHILKERNSVVIKGIIITIWIWLMLCIIIQYVFYKLDWSLVQFSNHAVNEQMPECEFRDFPQLAPVFRKIVELRNNLKKETEHYLEENQKIKKIIEMTPLAVLLVDKSGLIKDCNRAFLSYYPNFSKRTIYNVPYKILVESAGRKYDNTAICRALKGEEIRDEYDRFLGRSWISNAFPIRNKSGEITGGISVCHDITEFEQLRNEIERLDRLNIVGQMAASVAHEVRNPMAVARGYIQRLQLKTGDTYSGQLNTIIEELDRANAIISNFLSLARNKYVEKREESLCRIIAEIYPLIESEALARNMSCWLQLTEDMPRLLLNTEEVKQLILNLSMNAFDAMAEHGELTLSCGFSSEADGVLLTVSDTGCGIEEKEIVKLFEPFYTTKKSGSGLGLSVCKSIIERHGGDIRVESEIGKGTAFIIRFPLAKEN